jgi:hypothetical protein
MVILAEYISEEKLYIINAWFSHVALFVVCVAYVHVFNSFHLSSSLPVAHMALYLLTPFSVLTHNVSGERH